MIKTKLQTLIPSRAFKKLLWLICIWSLLCLLFRYTYYTSGPPTGGGAATLGQQQAAAFQGPNGIIYTIGGSGGVGSAGQIRSLLQKFSIDYVMNNPAAAAAAANNQIIGATTSMAGALVLGQNGLQSTPKGGVALSGLGGLSAAASLASAATSDSESDLLRSAKRFHQSEPHYDPQGLSDSELLSKLALGSNLPIVYWNKWQKLRKPGSTSSSQAAKKPGDPLAGDQSSSSTTNTNCKVDFPSLYELDYNNIYWQRYTSSNGTYYLYNAYYDDRIRGGPLASVRILAMIDRVNPPPALCLLWFDQMSSPLTVPATYVYGWYPKWGNYRDGVLQPFIVTCRVPRIKGFPRSTLIPDSVSLVEQKCDKPTNNIRVINNRPADGVKKEFAVCVKGLDFLQTDLSVRLIEWIELLHMLGADKIFLYELEIHPNISKVLDYYQEAGIVELTKITLAGSQPNLPGFRHLYLKNKLTHKRQNELIPYNDCLYRNLYQYQYLALLDIDEVIMPTKHDNWSGLMGEVQALSLADKNYTRASYNVRNVYFLDDLHDGEETKKGQTHGQLNSIGGAYDTAANDHGPPDIPRYLHMLQHVYRSRNYTKPGQYVKCFHNTDRVVSLHNHFPLNCFGSCTTYSIPTNLAQLQHYRKDCVGPLRKSCQTDFRAYTVKDTTIWKYKDQLIAKTNHVLQKLGFFN